MKYIVIAENHLYKLYKNCRNKYKVWIVHVFILTNLYVIKQTCSAASGQEQNQSIIQQFTKAGNCLMRARNTSPIGLNIENIILSLI